jgi:5'-deoxynucleotidase YfbR-like HD superfamily hydrolase
MITDEELKYLYRLKTIIRYNTRRHLKDESVAEHSFYVAIISLIICNKLNISEEDTGKCIIKALLHDMPEIETSDIPHDIKENLNLRGYLKTYEDKYFEDNFPKYYELMTKDCNIDDIVLLADSLSVLQYSNNEVELGNTSKEMLVIQQDAVDRVKKLYQKVNNRKEKYNNEN